MRPRPMFKGSITFGLVTLQCTAVLALDQPTTGAHLLHRDCLSRIQSKTWCPVHGEISRADTVRGWEVGRDRMVTLTDEEIDGLPVSTKHTIQVLQFLGREDTAALKRFPRQPYYLEPEALGRHGFSLLVKTLERSGTAALTKIAIRDREHLATLEPYRRALLLTTVAWPDEIRAVDELELPDERLAPAERRMAEMLVRAMKAPLDVAAHRDGYRDALDRLIEAKAAGGQVVDHAEPAGPVLLDLMAALEASVAAARANQPATPPADLAAARKRRSAA